MVIPKLFGCGAYLTAPKVMPCTSCFWQNQPSAMIGAIAISEAADSLAQNRPSGLEYEAISQASVPALAAPRLSDQNDSFQAQTMHTSAVEAMPPTASGSTMWRNSSTTVAPSMRDASRISRGSSRRLV